MSVRWVDDGENTAVVGTAEPCEWCGKPTHCIDLSFEARLCPSCHDTAWAGYWDAFWKVDQ